MQDCANLSSGSHGLLADLHVLELGQGVTGPYAAKMLADLGASVTKYEWPDRDPARRAGPFPPGRDDDPEFSGLFRYLNEGKRLAGSAGRSAAQLAAAVRAELPGASVVILDEHADWAAAGLAPADLQALNPALVVATVTPFGTDGPYGNWRAYDSTVSAAGGLSYGVGQPGRPPLPLPMSQASYQAALCAVIAILLALVARERDGRGQHVDISAHEVIASLHCGYFLPRYLYGGGIVGSRAGRAGGTQPYPNTVLRCADGLVVLSAPQIGQWLRFVDLMGRPSWTEEPRYRDRRAMQHEYKDEVNAFVEPWLERHTKQELLALFVQHRIPFAPILTGADLASHPHLIARGAIAEHRFPDGSAFLAPASPLRRAAAAPLPSTRARLAARMHAEAGRGAEPLAGLTVLDLGTAWAGGIAGRILGDFGADVIKVESWSHMDGSRMGRPIVIDDTAAGDRGEWPDLQPGFHVHGRSKRSVTLNLKDQGGLDLLYQLAERADLLLHNYPPSTARRLGLTASQLRSRCPDLLLVGQSVAGAVGPYSELIGYAGTVAGLSGLAQAVGYPGEEPIGMMEGLYCDVVSALTTAIAAIAGVLGILRGTGGPEAVDIAQWEATLALCPDAVMRWTIRAEDETSVGYTSATLVPHGAYLGSPAGTEERWACVAVGSDAEWRSFTRLLGDQWRTAEGWESWSLPARQLNAAGIDAAVAAWVAGVGAEHAVAALQGAGLAGALVCSIEDVFVDPQLRHRGAFADIEHPLAGIEPMPALGWRLSRTPGSIRRPAPLLGQHTREVLSSVLNLDETTIDRLIAAGAVETGPAGGRAPANIHAKGLSA